jgi:hypothetical protein
MKTTILIGNGVLGWLASEEVIDMAQFVYGIWRKAITAKKDQIWKVSKHF